MKVTGKVHPQSTMRRTRRIYEAKKMLGVITDDDGKIKAYTTIQIYVPQPQHIGHRPGVFLTLSNSVGQCFTRIDPLELDECIEWLQGLRPSTLSAFEQATTTYQAIQQSDKATFERLKRNEKTSTQEKTQEQE